MNVQITRAQEIVTLHNEIVSHLRQGLEKAIRIGELLAGEKKSKRHGQWLSWIKANLPFSDQTARNYMRLYDKRNILKIKNVLNLTDAYELLAHTNSDVKAVEMMRIADVIVGIRSRKDLRDLTSLQASIEDVGLLHPIVVDPNNTLIVGERRLEACKGLGWAEIPVRVAKNLTDALLLLQAERDENVERKDLVPSEAVAQAARFEALETEAARKRQAQAPGEPRGKKKLDSGGNLPQQKTRDKLGAAVGLSGRTYEKAKVYGALVSGVGKYGFTEKVA